MPAHHLDLHNPVIQLPYLGESVEDFIAMAEADGWDVYRLGDGHPKGDSLRVKLGIRTLIARPNEIQVRSRNGLVIGIGSSAYLSQ